MRVVYRQGKSLRKTRDYLYYLLYLLFFIESAIASEAIQKCSDILNLSRKNELSKFKAALDSIQDILKELKEFEDPDSDKLNKEYATDNKYQPTIMIKCIKIETLLLSEDEEMPMTSVPSR